VKVKVEGTPVVGVGRPDEVRDLAWFLDALTKDVFGQVLPRLEPFLSDAAGQASAPAASTET
jgi:hypothetical protein